MSNWLGYKWVLKHFDQRGKDLRREVEVGVCMCPDNDDREQRAYLLDVMLA